MQLNVNMQQALELFFVPDQITELRALNCNEKPHTRRGFYTPEQLTQMVLQANDWERKCGASIYFTPNPIDPDLLHSANLKNWQCATDQLIKVRHWVIIDIDRRSGDKRNPASDEELECLRQTVEQIRNDLTSERYQFRGGILVMSGNGYHLYFPISLPNDSKSHAQIEAFLKYLDRIYGDAHGEVDQKTKNASRVMKVPGAVSKKGEESKERPYRRSELIDGTAWNEDDARYNNEQIQHCLADWHTDLSVSQSKEKCKESSLISTPNGGLSNVELAKLWLEKRPPAVSGENGHDHTFGTVAYVMNGFELNEAEAFEVLYNWNQSCDPPWSEKELRHKIHDAFTKARHDKPRGHLLKNNTSLQQASSQSQDESEKWFSPVPLQPIPASVQFPIGVFPECIQQIAIELAASTNTPLDFSGCGILSTVSGAVGLSRRLCIKRRYHPTGCVWLALVGEKGSGKTPVMDFLIRPIKEVQSELYRQFQVDKARWEEADPETRELLPTLRRTWTENATTEGLCNVLEVNPRGIILHKDELRGLITSMDQYKGQGSDRQFFLSLNSSGSIMIDRKSKSDRIPQSIEHPFVAIIGGIQPAVIESMVHDRFGSSKLHQDDGFIPRFLFCYPDLPPAVGDMGVEVSAECDETWNKIIRSLLEINMVQTSERGDFSPVIINLSQEARELWIQFTNEMAAEINDDDFDQPLFRGWWMKLQDYTARIALLLHCLEAACEEQRIPPELQRDTLACAIQLISYFKVQVWRIHNLFSADRRSIGAGKILTYLQKNKEVTKISGRDLWRSMRRRFPSQDDFNAALNLLIEHEYLREGHLAQQRGRGRKPSPTYLINPLWAR